MLSQLFTVFYFLKAFPVAGFWTKNAGDIVFNVLVWGFTYSLVGMIKRMGVLGW